jgi:hypothetical protein
MSEISPVDMQRALKGMEYPASHEDLMMCAERNGADRKMQEEIKGLPDHRYDGPDDVSKEMFGRS